MPSALSRSVSHRRSRKLNSPVNQPQPVSPIYISSAEAVGSVLTVAFDQAVTLGKGMVPGIRTDVEEAEPVSAVQTAPNVVAITFNGSLAAATQLRISFQDPAIRNVCGGYVAGQVANM